MKLTSQLNKRERLILALTIILVSFALISKFALRPLFTLNAKLAQELKTKQVHLKRLERMAGRKALKDEYETFIRALKMSESQELEMARFLSEIEKLATNSGVNILSLRPQEIEERKSYRRFLVELKCEGNNQQILQFVFLLESSPLLLKIERFQLSSSTSTPGLLTSDLTVSRIAIP
jgi:Tfp pilus assembly protein PilO